MVVTFGGKRSMATEDTSVWEAFVSTIKATAIFIIEIVSAFIQFVFIAALALSMNLAVKWCAAR